MQKFLLFLCFLLPFSAWSENRVLSPQFEWGIGCLFLGLHHYRGSDQAHYKIVPTPYFSYRSEKLEAEPNLVRATFFKNDHWTLKLSLMGGFNLQSGINRAREKMEPLDYTLEAGPVVIYLLWQSQRGEKKLTAEWALRQVYKTDLYHFSPLGIYHTPYLNFAFKNIKNQFQMELELSAGPMFNQKSIHQYYYDVQPKDSTPTRAEFYSNGGYSGMQTMLLAQLRIRQWKLITFYRWDDLSRAVFRDSPLSRQRSYFLFGGGVYWLFK